MAGFLGESWEDPRTALILGMGAGFLSDNGSRGLSAGLLGGMNAYGAAKTNAANEEYRRMQMENLRSETAQRNAAMQQAAQKTAFWDRMLPVGQAAAAPGMPASATGLPGIGPEQAARFAQSQQGAFLASLNEDQLLALQARGFLPPGSEKLWEIAKFGKERKQGDFVEMSDGSRRMTPMVKEGLGFGATGVEVLPGAVQARQQLTLAEELAKAAAASAGRVNLRKNPDGTDSPVVELTENPVLQRHLGGGQQAPQQPARPTAPTRITPEEQRARDAESIRVIQAEVDAEKDPAKREGLQREVNRMVNAQKGAGFPTPSASSPVGTGYGKTTAQQTAEEAARTKAIEQAKADVVPEAQKREAIASGEYMMSLLGRAMNHPGRETATGLSGSIDPRNFVPGTNATDFRTMLGQIKGGAFLEAYKSLKGGGAITTIEGEKAEKAIARLDTAQSDKEFKDALSEFQGIVANATARMKGGTGAPPSANASAPNAPAVGAIQGGYRFKGGNPADPSSWERQ